MILNERDAREQSVDDVARRMMIAARTAPKGKGVDIIECASVSGLDLAVLAEEMRAISEETGYKFFLRDALSVEQAQCVVIIGTRPLAQGLNCGHCGFRTCAERTAQVPCEINSVDVGIALGSACSVAADCRVDSRVMFSAGLAAERLHWLGEDVAEVYAIAVSASSKSPFFDRKSPTANTQ